MPDAQPPRRNMRVLWVPVLLRKQSGSTNARCRSLPSLLVSTVHVHEWDLHPTSAQSHKVAKRATTKPLGLCSMQKQKCNATQLLPTAKFEETNSWWIYNIYT